MVWTIITFIVLGLVAGALARLIVPGKQDLSIVATIVLGIIGSFVGGTLWSLIVNQEFNLESASWIGSIIGAVLVLLAYLQFQKRSISR